MPSRRSTSDPTRTPSPDAAYFHIEVQGVLDPRWRPRFADLEFESVHAAGHGITRMRGWLTDQAELYAVLAAVRDLGLMLLSVQRWPEQP